MSDNGTHQLLTVRVGCDMHFACESPATAILLINPRFDSEHAVRQEIVDFGETAKSESFTDAEGNTSHRVIMQPGVNKIRHDALVEVSASSDKSEHLGEAASVGTLKPSLLESAPFESV